MAKKLCALALATVLILSMFTSAFATNSTEIKSLTVEAKAPRGMTCGCGGQMNIFSTSYGAWTSQGYNNPCTAHNRYDHAEQKEARTVNVIEKCDDCGYQYPYSKTEYRKYCR